MDTVPEWLGLGLTLGEGEGEGEEDWLCDTVGLALCVGDTLAEREAELQPEGVMLPLPLLLGVLVPEDVAQCVELTLFVGEREAVGEVEGDLEGLEDAVVVVEEEGHREDEALLVEERHSVGEVLPVEEVEAHLLGEGDPVPLRVALPDLLAEPHAVEEALALETAERLLVTEGEGELDGVVVGDTVAEAHLLLVGVALGQREPEGEGEVVPEVLGEALTLEQAL